MERGTIAGGLLSLTLFCATLTAQQPEEYEADGAQSFISDSVEQDATADVADEVAESVGDCYGDCCCCCEPWRLFPQSGHGLEIYGWLNAGYVINPEYPSSKFNGPYNAVDRANEPMLNQAYLVAEKKLSDDCCHSIGGRVDLLYGEDFLLAQSIGLETRDDGSPHWNPEYYGLAIPQAYVELGHSAFSIKVGKFYSIVGYEGLPAVNNFFYSKAYSYQFAGPFTHCGALATWAPSDCWEFQAGLTNCWDTFDIEPEDQANLLAKATYTDCCGWWTSFAVVTGDNFNNLGGLPIVDEFTNRTRYSWLVSLPVDCSLDYVFHHWLGSQDNGAVGGETAYWYGIDQYLTYTINDCWKVGMRFEWFRDEDGTRVGLNRASNPNNVPFAGNFYSLSAGINWMPTCNLTVRPEIRCDWFDGAQVVQPFDDGNDDSQLLLAVDAILTF